MEEADFSGTILLQKCRETGVVDKIAQVSARVLGDSYIHIGLVTSYSRLTVCQEGRTTPAK